MIATDVERYFFIALFLQVNQTIKNFYDYFTANTFTGPNSPEVSRGEFAW